MSLTYIPVRQTPVNGSGRPYAGARAFFYRAGTASPQAVFANSGRTSQHPHPVVADSAGRFPAIYLAPDNPYRCVLQDSSGNTLADDDNIPATAPVTTATIGTALYPQTPGEIATGVTPTAYQFAPMDVRRYGADPTGTTDSTAAFASAINVAAHNGGTVTAGEGNSYRISSTLILGIRVTLDLGNGVLTQNGTNTPIVQVSRGTINYQWGVRNGTLRYATQQTAAQTNAVGIRLATTNTVSYLGTVENVRIEGACTGIDLPELSGATAFLVTFKNVWCYQCAGYGIDILGGVSGARTNLIFDGCYVENIAGAEISTSKGVRIKRTQELTIRNLAIDHVKNGPVVFLESCYGVDLDSCAIESCDVAASSDSTGFFLFSGCEVSADVLGMFDNTVNLSGTADGYAIRTASDSVVTVNFLYDSNTSVTDTSSGGYYAVLSSGTADRLNVWSHKIDAATPAALYADAGIAKKLRHIDGNDRTRQFNGNLHVPSATAPASETWTAGDVAWNSAVTAGEPLGWICTVGGTPGTWVAFGQAGQRTGTATPVGSVTPHFVGEEYLDTTAVKWWKSTGAGSSDWVALN